MFFVALSSVDCFVQSHTKGEMRIILNPHEYGTVFGLLSPSCHQREIATNDCKPVWLLSLLLHVAAGKKPIRNKCTNPSVCSAFAVNLGCLGVRREVFHQSEGSLNPGLPGPHVSVLWHDTEPQSAPDAFISVNMRLVWIWWKAPHVRLNKCIYKRRCQRTLYVWLGDYNKCFCSMKHLSSSYLCLYEKKVTHWKAVVLCWSYNNNLEHLLKVSAPVDQS